MTSDRKLTRRAMLRALGGGAAVIALPTLIACGGDETTPTAGAARSTPQSSSSASTPTSGSAATSPAAPSGASTPSAAASPSAATPAIGTSAVGTPAASPAVSGSITIYSGRNEALIGRLIDQFKRDTGIDVSVRYGDTAELAAAILDEGRNSRADVFFAQDAGALGALAKEGRFQALPDDVLNRVDARFRSNVGLWVGVSGRARAVVYNVANVREQEIPASILNFTDARWRGKLGWAPTNASFQAFVTALRVINGDARAREWLQAMKNNGVRSYEANAAIVRAVMSGEIDAGFVNHYYLYAQIKELTGATAQNPPAQNYIYRNGDPGALVNVAGLGILREARNLPAAQAFARYLLTQPAQTYFSNETFEYPVVNGVPADPRLVPLAEIRTPNIDLSNLADLQGTLSMLRDTGVL